MEGIMKNTVVELDLGIKKKQMDSFFKALELESEDNQH